MDYNNLGNQPNQSNRPDFQQTWEMRYIKATKTSSMFFFASVISLILRTIFLPFIFGAISIIFAYLAKGTKAKSPKYNILLIVFSVVIMAINAGYSTYYVYSVTHDEEMIAQLNEVSQSFYGMDFDEYMQQMKVSFTGGAANE